MASEEDRKREEAGLVGVRLAETLVNRVNETIEAFPHAPDEQKAAIAWLVSEGVLAKFEVV